MPKSLIVWGLALASVAVAATVPAAAEARSSRTLHVEVNEKGGDRVSIAVPVGFARAALAIAGKVHVELETDDVSVSELRGMWKELRESGRSATIDVKDGNDSVKITNRRGIVLVDVKEAGGDSVKIAVPETAVDALLGGSDDSLDLGAALGALDDAHVGDIVHVEDGADSVRIWIE